MVENAMPNTAECACWEWIKKTIRTKIAVDYVGAGYLVSKNTEVEDKINCHCKNMLPFLFLQMWFIFMFLPSFVAFIRFSDKLHFSRYTAKKMVFIFNRSTFFGWPKTHSVSNLFQEYLYNFPPFSFIHSFFVCLFRFALNSLIFQFIDLVCCFIDFHAFICMSEHFFSALFSVYLSKCELNSIL